MSGTVSNCQRKMRDEGDGRKPSGPAAGLHVMWAGAEIRESSAKWATSILKSPGSAQKGGGYISRYAATLTRHIFQVDGAPQSPPVGSHGVGSAGREGASRVRVRSPCRWGGAHNEPSACDDPSNACGAWKKSKSTTTFFLEL